MNQKTVIVIGGGPAGMMAAITASSFGSKVILLEKNEILGKKLLITGGGRCNVTNNIQDNRVLLKKYKEAEQYLYSPFSEFSVKDTIDFFNKNGIPLKEEAHGRMFPVTNKSESILEAFQKNITEEKITVKLNTKVSKIIIEEEKIIGVETGKKEKIYGDEFIIATGGLSHTETGSTGDGFNWLRKLGHNIIKPNASLVPITTKEKWSHILQGLSYMDTTVKIIENGKVVEKKSGKILFTHVGLSGPLILNMSKSISDRMSNYDILLSIDLFPKLDEGALDKVIQEKISKVQNKILSNSLVEVIEKTFVEQMLRQLKIDGSKFTHQLTREERKSIAYFLKNIILTPTGLLGIDKAIVTSGGVPLNEVNMKRMSSTLYNNLYVVGDMLNIDRPSGGYSLQLCYTTGYVAGKYASKKQ